MEYEVLKDKHSEKKAYLRAQLAEAQAKPPQDYHDPVDVERLQNLEKAVNILKSEKDALQKQLKEVQEQPRQE